jgi:hypothetical protein
MKQNIVKYRPIARQRLSKHTPAEANALKNMTSIARQRISKHNSLTIEDVFSAQSVQGGYKEVFSATEQFQFWRGNREKSFSSAQRGVSDRVKSVRHQFSWNSLFSQPSVQLVVT